MYFIWYTGKLYMKTIPGDMVSFSPKAYQQTLFVTGSSKALVSALSAQANDEPVWRSDVCFRDENLSERLNSFTFSASIILYSVVEIRW